MRKCNMTSKTTPRELILDVLGALDWGGPVRIASTNVSIHIHGIPRGGTWRDGVVDVETIPPSGHSFDSRACSWPPMTDAEALTEAAELIEYAASRLTGAPDRVAAAREVLRLAAEERRTD